jgi:ubiquinone/menaquinone biosynthesis C-methylase UbiE
LSKHNNFHFVIDQTNEAYKGHFNPNMYDSQERFFAYYYQIREILRTNPLSVLEIGIGNKFVSSYLEKIGLKVVNLDILRSLLPDVKASILQMPFKEKSLDVCLCCEVLEHLPFECFSQALLELNRVCKSYTVISVPDSSYYFGLHVNFPIRIPRVMFSFPKLLHRKMVLEENVVHYWEIGYQGYPLSKIKMEMAKAGFKVVDTYRVPEKPDCRMFLLKKTDKVKS